MGAEKNLDDISNQFCFTRRSQSSHAQQHVNLDKDTTKTQVWSRDTQNYTYSKSPISCSCSSSDLLSWGERLFNQTKQNNQIYDSPKPQNYYHCYVTLTKANCWRCFFLLTALSSTPFSSMYTHRNATLKTMWHQTNVHVFLAFVWPRIRQNDDECLEIDKVRD